MRSKIQMYLDFSVCSDLCVLCGSFMPLVLEGLVSTLDSDGRPHLAPMGPHVPAAEFDHFNLRPFPTSLTFRNLKRHGEGVLHVTDDVLLLARAAIGAFEPTPM